MKVQFDTADVRIRLTRAEFASLQGGARLEARIDWPQAPWSVTVSAADTIEVRGQGAAVDITLPKTDVDDLATRLPARDGLKYTIDHPNGLLELRIEVDLHDGRARRR
ncbi:DUF7009 family protein [Lysobacter sp. HA35]